VTDPIVLVGSPTSLGGHFGGMERTPPELRARGLVGRLAALPGLRGAPLTDAGDAPVEPGWAPDPDRRAKNRELLVDSLPRIADHVAAALRSVGPATRLLVVGGDCTSHAAALAGLRRGRTGLGRLALVWFDAHGDFNTPDTTPSGNVWGMPFAMACGRGDPDLVAAVDGPTVREADAALLGGQILDETESRMLAASGVAHFGAGMLADPAGLAALDAWSAVVAARIEGLYVAFDLDALDRSDGWAVAMPEPGGLSLAAALAAVRTVAGRMPVVGFGATAVLFDGSGDPAAADRTVEAVAVLAEAALA
jgi:arginase